MKKALHLSLLAIIIIAAASCTKYVESPRSRMEGSWTLQLVERSGKYGTERIYTGFENGVFDFMPGGSASYSDGLGTLNGRWEMRNVREGYYDGGGHYQERTIQVLYVNVSNYSGSRVFSVEFDELQFSGNNYFTGGYQTDNYDYWYDFARY